MIAPSVISRCGILYSHSAVTRESQGEGLTRVTTWWLTHVPAERGAERARGPIPHTPCDFGYPEVRLAKQVLRDGHPPGEQVFHWCHANGPREALEERRARKRGRPRELSHRPRARDVGVHLMNRGRQPRIGQSAQQAWRRVVARRRPECLDEQHLHESREDEIAARSPLARLLADEAHQHREPLHAPYVHDGRQQ